ncbi:hypothetical protein FHR70_000661 [Microvirga lupini]|uniref:Zinc finger CHC2-type domain-containing protein n=1 Tax=Microvirga lupini TaxID=420324 RepID=A0A7W4VI44_9HYPH|nr:CHC2 zinc finger domain-containing protein [Microvirga lupini]MBB3017621.1 hypothetical protein [Microvirga lupini]
MAQVPASTIERAKADIVGTISKYLELKKVGQEYEACCPFHSEKTPSFRVVPEKRFFYCFGCGAGGDATDFVQDFESIGFRDAIARIVNDQSIGDAVPKARQTVKKEVEAEWEPVVPVPANIKQRPMDTFNRRKGGEWERLVSSKRWEYRDANGGLIGYICRFELPGGGKDVIPQTYCVNKQTGEMRWKWLSFAKPRPIYGLDKLAKHPLAQVILAEGEKAADAAQALYEAAGISRDKLVVVSWPGGGKAVPHVDWSPLAGRNVGLWPDADQKPYVDTHPKAGQLMPFIEQPGAVCMLDIAERIEGQVNSLKFIMPPEGVEDGWDLADALPAGFNLLAHTRAAAMPIADFREKHVPAAEPEQIMPWDDEPDADDIALACGVDPAPVAEQQAQAPAPAAPQPKPAPGDDWEDPLIKNGHFTILGYDRGKYYFFVHEKRQVMAYQKGDFSDAGMLELAEINWWEEHFPGERGSMNKKMALNWIFRTANRRGVYDPERVRGRGAWTDNKRAVFHHGGHLTVDGVYTDITAMRSAYVYQVERSIPAPAVEPMTDEEGSWLVSVAEMARWSMAGSAALLAGFVMLAPICGALPWRSHIWLTGGAGSGKSTLQSKYAASLLRGVSVYATGDSTEPGIRQSLQADSLPVLIDEIESNNDNDKRRVENIIGMIRKTSTESQAQTLKGTVSGDGQSFHVRSMFCLASINVNMPSKADTDRLTKLVLRPPIADSRDHWDKLEAELNKIEEDEDISSRLLARALGMMPVILETVKVFRRAAAKHFGTQRQGDQFGTLLAGSWCLQKSTVPSEEEAMVLIRGYNWNEHVEDNDQDDAARAVEALLGAKLRAKSLGGSTDEYSVYELIRECSPMHRHNVIDVGVADATLKRHGIRVEHATGELWFGTSVTNLVQMASGMSFVTDLRGQLLRVKGAKRISGSKKFNGSDSKVVSIPLDPILGDEKEAGSSDDLPI